MATTSTRSADLAQLLREARTRPAPVYLFTGEPARTGAAARALVETLLPGGDRSVQLEIRDGRDAAAIADSLRMQGLFGGGRKVLLVRDPPFLTGQSRPAEIAAEMFAAWSEGRQRVAAERLLRLAAMAGWNRERFEEAEWAGLRDSELEKVLGRRPSPGERAAIPDIARHALELGRSPSDFRDDAGTIEEALEGPLAPGVVLVLTAAAPDRRRRLYRRIQQIGRVLDLAVERERSGALAAGTVREAIGEVLGREGKSIDPAAAALVERRAGADFGAVLCELEKLCLYVGDRRRISRADVERGFRDMSAAWVFDLTRALAERRAAAALDLLHGLLDAGEPPLRLVGLMAREIRTLLLARDCLEGSLARAWRQDLPYTAFRDRLLPGLTEEEKAAMGKTHPYVLYLALQNSSRIPPLVLERALRRLQAIDVRLKSSASDARLLLERFVLETTGQWA